MVDYICMSVRVSGRLGMHVQLGECLVVSAYVYLYTCVHMHGMCA